MNAHAEIKDIDIIDINLKILENFDKQISTLPKLKKHLSELENTETDKIPLRTRKILEKNIENLKEEIRTIETGEKKNFYIVETIELIEKYTELLKKPQKVSFCGKPNIENKERDNVVRKYIELIKDYWNIAIKLPEEKKYVGTKLSCNNCSNKTDFEMDENYYTCKKCWSQQEQEPTITSYKDSDRVNISVKYTYDRKIHFRDCILQYQGKQNCTIDQKIYDNLEKAFENHGLLIGDKTTKKELRFSKITRDNVLMFLKEEEGGSKHYENVILIHYNMTGKKPDDISHLEELLLADFDVLVDLYDKKFKNKVKRVNFISAPYVLYQLLRRHKHPCKKEDFVILKTIDGKMFCDNVYGELSKELEWYSEPLY